MRIRLLADIAGPMGVYRKGEVAEITDGIASGLVGAGYAVLDVIIPPAADTTSLEPPVMAAPVAPRRGRPRKG